MKHSSISSANFSCAARQRGFSMLELSLTLVIMGILAFSGSALMNTFEKFQENRNRTTSAELARQSLLTYLAREKRLPCPDMSGNGWPGDENGVCDSQADLGYLPYRILDFTLSSYDEDIAQRIIYGVFRDGVTADLVEPYAPTENIVGDANHAAIFHTLHQVAKMDIKNSRPYITGHETNPDMPGLAENCNIVVNNPAFVLVIPGTLDRNGNRVLGGINAPLPKNRKCIAAPERNPTPDNNDTVHAESRLELLGWYVHLTQSSSSR